MSIAPGDLVVMHDFQTVGHLAIILPGGEQLALEGQLVRVLSVKTYGNLPAKFVTFRPEPWNYPPETWPNAWEAVERYFRRVDDPER